MVKSLPTAQKLRGGYYTPKPIADFLAQWAIALPTTTVLEPSCGDGSLLFAAAEALLEKGAPLCEVANLIEGVEFDPYEAEIAKDRLRSLGISEASLKLHIGDFFSYCRDSLLQQDFLGVSVTSGKTFDAVIGNPPFIRYQNFPEMHSDIAFKIMRSLGFHPNRLTNSWVPFLVISSFLLTRHGRLAMIIPAELFQVSYAAEVRQFLSTFFSKITLITFKKLVFSGIQQEVILLLAERDGAENIGIQVVELENLEDLIAYPITHTMQMELKPMDHSSEKWTQYFLNSDEINLLRALRKHPKLILTGDIMTVDVGVVTGQNDFFILTKDQVSNHSLSKYVDRVVSRSGQLDGTIFKNTDWLALANNQSSTYILAIPKCARNELPVPVQKYIEAGEQVGFHRGFKCRTRSPWYTVPSIWNPDAFMLRQVHGYPKLVFNKAQATCTDTLHRVKFKENGDPQIAIGSFLNSLTFAFAEVTGRSYGGGVLTFEPSEAERLPIPYFEGAGNLTKIDKLLRTKGIDAVLDMTDQILLIERLHLSPKDARMLREIWRKLRDRRINRK